MLARAASAAWRAASAAWRRDQVNSIAVVSKAKNGSAGRLLLMVQALQHQARGIIRRDAGEARQAAESGRKRRNKKRRSGMACDIINGGSVKKKKNKTS